MISNPQNQSNSSGIVRHLWKRVETPEAGFTVFLAAAIIVSIVEYFKGVKPLYGADYYHYNNYIIFKSSLFNLINQVNLYAPHPEQYFDLYKYSPSFPLFMAPMAWLPNWFGLMIWNLINSLPLFAAIMLLPHLSTRVRVTISWLVLVDMMTSLHNAQSNGIMAALFVLAFVCMEREKLIWAALCIVLMIYVKLFGIVGLMLFALYPRRLKAVMVVMGWTLVIGLAPLILVAPSYLVSQYSEWLRLLGTDAARGYGISLLGLIESWSGVSLPKFGTLILGAVILASPLLKVSRYRSYAFRLLLLASILIWVVIFNHKAESNTFLLATAGVALWYFAADRSKLHHILLIASILLVTFSPTDLFPTYIRGEFIVPYKMKALPPILVWFAMQWELWQGRRVGVPTESANGSSD